MQFHWFIFFSTVNTIEKEWTLVSRWCKVVYQRCNISTSACLIIHHLNIQSAMWAIIHAIIGLLNVIINMWWLRHTQT